tara:strand:+ start:387 stop:590 length:204 start_codon:yes stop_codon:yes gene_type:complete
MKKLLLLLIIPLLFSCNENRKVQELEQKIIDLERSKGHKTYEFYELGDSLDKEGIQDQGFHINSPWN